MSAVFSSAVSSNENNTLCKRTVSKCFKLNRLCALDQLAYKFIFLKIMLNVTRSQEAAYYQLLIIDFSPSPTPLIGAKGGFDGPLPTKPPLFLRIIADTGAQPEFSAISRSSDFL